MDLGELRMTAGFRNVVSWVNDKADSNPNKQTSLPHLSSGPPNGATAQAATSSFSVSSVKVVCRSVEISESSAGDRVRAHVVAIPRCPVLVWETIVTETDSPAKSGAPPRHHPIPLIN